MAAQQKVFDDAYYSSCSTCGEPLAWEWSEDDLAFAASCGCMKQHRLAPLNAEIETIEEGDEEELFEEED